VRLVVPLGHTGDGHAGVLAEVKAHRADQVADILDEQQVHLAQGELVEGHAHLQGVEVTAAAGVDLHGGQAQGAHLVGIDARGHVPLDHRHATALAQRQGGPSDQRGLARARRGHDVDAVHAVSVQEGAIAGGGGVIGAQNLLNDRDLLGGHGLLHLDALDIELATGLDAGRGGTAGRAGPVGVGRAPTVLAGATDQPHGEAVEG